VLVAGRRIPEGVRGLFAALEAAMAGDESKLREWQSRSFPALAETLGSDELAATVERKAYEFAGRGGTVRDELAWMARVARNSKVEEMRSRIGPPIGDVAQVLRPDPERAERVREAVKSAILGLRSPYREAMLLRYLEDCPPRRVMDLLVETREITESGARLILWRGHAMLQRAVARRLGLPLSTLRKRIPDFL